MYSKEEWNDVAGVNKNWYCKAECFSIGRMHDGADTYVSNPSVYYDIHKIIIAGK